MPRPTDAPRLHALDPDAVAREVDDRLEAFFGRLAPALTLGFDLRAGRLAGGQSGLAATAHALTVYAQRGLPVWDWETHGEAEDACHGIVTHLWGRPADAGRGETSDVGPLDEALSSDLDDPLALVLVAAWARVSLARGEGLTARQLAALGGMAPRAVLNLAAAGELRLEGARPAAAPPREARRWLEARGVKGL